MSNTPPCTYKLSPTPFTPPSTAVAYGSFVDDGDDPSSGWGKVEVTSSSGGESERDGIAAYAAGFAEGLMTAERIGQLWTNFMPGQFGPKGPSPHLFPYINTSLHYALDMGKVDYANPSSDGEWQYNAQLGLVMNQVQGVADGYAQARGESMPDLDLLDLVVLNSIGDLDDLVPAMRVLYPETDGRVFASHGVDLSPRRLAEIESGGHCSLFIKPMPGQGLVAAHEMWASFWQMTLMYKSVELDVTLESTLAKTVTYSSYPAMVSSEDDFYLTSAGLQVMETTNSVLNVSIYDVIQPQSLLSWMRVVMANRMTDSGPAWADVFQAHNSGTYNNMWVITNHNIVPLDAVDLPPHSVTIASQMPGVVRVMDETPIIASQGYFPSYNVPLIPELFDLAGYPAAVKEYGNVWSYGQNPRTHLPDQGAQRHVSGGRADAHAVQRLHPGPVLPRLPRLILRLLTPSSSGVASAEARPLVPSTERSRPPTLLSMPSLAPTSLLGPHTRLLSPLPFPGRRPSLTTSLMLASPISLTLTGSRCRVPSSSSSPKAERSPPL